MPGAGEALVDGLRGRHTAVPQEPPVTSKFWKHPPGKALMAWAGGALKAWQGLSAEASAEDEQGGGEETRQDTECVARTAGGAADGWQKQAHVVPMG